MSIEDVFPIIPFSDTEEDLVIEALSIPAVKKYLTRMAQEDAKELLALSGTQEQLAIAHATVQGKLSTISTLLSIRRSE